MLLDRINSPQDLKKLNIEQLNQLADEIRSFMLEKLAPVGGHVASNLGTVELTLAIHYVFNSPEDKIIWDVGHQCYTHKIITGRKDKFHTIRQYKGLSGFPKPEESPHDIFIAGHASTSLALSAGTVIARDLNKKNFNVIAVIGDGALTGGLAHEGLNNLGCLKKHLIIILNTNEMSISPNIGAFASYFNRIITSSIYYTIKTRLDRALFKIPVIGKFLYNLKNKITELVKGAFVPGLLFEELGFMYVGPENGHNLKSLINTLTRLKNIKERPIIYHVITKKGKGYKPAEENSSRFHSAGPFILETGEFIKREGMSFTEVFGKTLALLGERDKKIVAITAAMEDGTGLVYFKKKFPERFFDVGIAEGFAVTFSAALAKFGLKPCVAIYSTFLQRAFDQLIHDIAISKFPVKFFLDRAGIVPGDGETHQGIFDLSYLKLIPGAVILAPKDGLSLQKMIISAVNYSKGPVFVRYPKMIIPEKYIDLTRLPKPVKIGEHKILNKGKKLLLIGAGILSQMFLDILPLLQKYKLNPTLIDLQTIKPLNTKELIPIIREHKYIITGEENTIYGGIGESIGSLIARNNLKVKFDMIGINDCFIEHGDLNSLRKKFGLTPDKLSERILKFVKQ